MYVQRFLKYLPTEKGQKFTLNCVAATGIGLFCANYIPNALLAGQFKSILQAYKQGTEREVPEKLQRRFEYAMDLCKCTDFEKKFLKPFIAFGFDTIQIGGTMQTSNLDGSAYVGTSLQRLVTLWHVLPLRLFSSLKSRYGGYIGIPTNYLYDKISEIERSDIRYKEKEINWSSKDGESLQNSLVLSEIEQVFGIARSIIQIKTHKLLLTSMYPPICLVSMYATAHYINQRMNFYVRPLMLRVGLYAILGLFNFGIYSSLTDFTEVYYEKCADRELAELGPEVTAAGLNFYDKMLKKNVALRNLTGENIYTAMGNENYFLRQKSIPLTIRKSFFEMKKKEFDEAGPAKLAS